MKENFQIIVIVVFIALAVFGLLVFSGAIPIGNDDAPGGLGAVTLWGTVKTATMAPLLEEFNNINQTFVVKYAQKSADTFDQDLLEALADGRGPDLFFLPDNLAFHYANKIFAIPFASYPLATFKNNEREFSNYSYCRLHHIGGFRSFGFFRRDSDWQRRRAGRFRRGHFMGNGQNGDHGAAFGRI